MEGKIQNLNADKGFGFIRSDKFSKDIFFHFTDYRGEFRDLSKGDSVSFETQETPKGIKAIQVKLI